MPGLEQTPAAGEQRRLSAAAHRRREHPEPTRSRGTALPDLRYGLTKARKGSCCARTARLRCAIWVTPSTVLPSPRWTSPSRFSPLIGGIAQWGPPSPAQLVTDSCAPHSLGVTDARGGQECLPPVWSCFRALITHPLQATGTLVGKARSGWSRVPAAAPLQQHPAGAAAPLTTQETGCEICFPPTLLPGMDNSLAGTCCWATGSCLVLCAY